MNATRTVISRFNSKHLLNVSPKMMSTALQSLTGCVLAAGLFIAWDVTAADAKKPEKPKKQKKEPKVVGPWVTPVLPGGKEVVTETLPEFLKAPDTLDPGVKVAQAVPTVDFAYFPGQTYAAEIWSVWGNSLCANGKYYASLGDHMYVPKQYPQSPGHHGTAYVYEYGPLAKTFRLLMNTSEVLKVPEGVYLPGKIHSRLDMGKDGWLYCSTHSGSDRATSDPASNYKGDWILRCNPATGKTEIVAQAPVPKHSLPNSTLDPKRMILYGGSAAGEKQANDADAIMFFAYDVVNHKMLYCGNNGPGRGLILAQSTGKVYYTPKLQLSPIMCYDPAKPSQPPKEIPGEVGNRTATRETPDGIVYSASQANKSTNSQANLYAFNTKTEKAEVIGTTSIGTGAAASLNYVAAMDADPTGRYVYYTLGAHGGSEKVGSALVQLDTKTKQKKVIAFLSPAIQQKYGVTPTGSFSLAVDEKGEKVFITWNSKRDGTSAAWDTVTLTVVHVPESERPAEREKSRPLTPLR